MTTATKVPAEFWRKHRILPLEDEADSIVVGIEETTSRDLLEDIRLLLNKDVRARILSSDQLDEGLHRMLLEGEDFLAEGPQELGDKADFSQDLLREAGDARIVRMVNGFFLKSMELRASDIHIEPFETESIVRLRVDGVLHEHSRIPPSTQKEITARLKVMSKLDLAETRRPQDGRLQVHSGNRKVDVRLSTVPTLYGERVVMRLLEKNTRALSMNELGLLEDTQRILLDCLGHSYGLVLVTGPTGSGKTTTLYTLLQLLSKPECNVLTIEDPVEYRMNGVGQIQVNERIGVTFASGLRSILRQDPDVVMVGEIRDPDTANIAVNAALTGHMVLSTLHTNDAPTAATRLMDLKVPPFLLSSCLLGVMAQRLVRRLCDKCKQPGKPTMETWRRLGLDRPPANHSVCEPVGCAHCMDTGYRGRMGIYELFKVEEELASRIAREEDARLLRNHARSKGMRLLMEDAAEKVIRGLTSPDEAVRVARAQ